MMYQWGQEGLLMPDAATTTENNLLSGNGFAQFENIKPGKEVEVEKSNNRDIVLVETLPANSCRRTTSSSPTVPSTPKRPWSCGR